MDCNRARRQLESMRGWGDGALLQHLRRCADCRDCAGELRVRDLLGTLPAPEPAAGFERRLVAAALPERRPPASRLRGWQFATAAGLLLAVLVVCFRGQSPVVPVSMTTPPISVSLDTPRNLSGATIRVSLPPNLALEGYGDTRQLQWRADLNAGANRLTLPLRLRGAAGEAEIVIRVEHGGAYREFRVPVQVVPANGDRRRPTTHL
ncbi:hypothetical protein [Microbulbifer litoralis]|uniref:hypothetical protein n=1 Tax=Microbulbifer litoralis TaxID=2933965 RepID=UPI0020296B67|nr:hypothetical protein [Microbulbifer sp. GX H0434]